MDHKIGHSQIHELIPTAQIELQSLYILNSYSSISGFLENRFTQNIQSIKTIP